MTKLMPLNDRIVVDPIWPPNHTAAGIIAPAGYERRPYRGTVLAVGPGRIGNKGQRIPMRCQAGMIIRFHNLQPLEYQIEIDGKKLFMMRDDDALAVEVADNEFYCPNCFDWVKAPHDCPAIKKQEKLKAPAPKSFQRSVSPMECLCDEGYYNDGKCPVSNPACPHTSSRL